LLHSTKERAEEEAKLTAKVNPSYSFSFLPKKRKTFPAILLKFRRERAELSMENR